MAWPERHKCAFCLGWGAFPPVHALILTHVAVPTQYSPMGCESYGMRICRGCAVVLAGEPAALIVEEADGRSVGMLTKSDDLEALMGRLSRRGERERSLLGALKKQHEQLGSELGSRAVILDPQLIPRCVLQHGLLHKFSSNHSQQTRPPFDRLEVQNVLQ